MVDIYKLLELLQSCDNDNCGCLGRWLEKEVRKIKTPEIGIDGLCVVCGILTKNIDYICHKHNKKW